MRQFKLGVAIALAVALGACTGNETTATNAIDANITGTWSYTATGLSGAVSFTCSIFGATMTISQSGGIVSGTVSGGTVTCAAPDGSSATSEPLAGGPLVRSQVNGKIAQLNFGQLNIQNVGTVSGNSIFGQVAVRGVRGTSAQLLGQFSMVRQ